MESTGEAHIKRLSAYRNAPKHTYVGYVNLITREELIYTIPDHETSMGSHCLKISLIYIDICMGCLSKLLVQVSFYHTYIYNNHIYCNKRGHQHSLCCQALIVPLSLLGMYQK